MRRIIKPKVSNEKISRNFYFFLPSLVMALGLKCNANELLQLYYLYIDATFRKGTVLRRSKNENESSNDDDDDSDDGDDEMCVRGIYNCNE